MITNAALLLTNSLRLPVFVQRLGSSVKAYPPNQPTAEFILNGSYEMDELLYRDASPFAARYTRTPYDECFIIIRVEEDTWFWLGPVLTKPVLEGRVHELIRSLGLPIHRKSALADYFSSLQVLTQDQYYYAGQAAQLLLRDREIGGEAGATTQEEIRPVFSSRSEVEGRLGMFEHPPYFMELEMTRLVTTGDLDSAIDLMNRINTFNRAVLAREPVRSLKNSLICDCTFLARAAISGGAAPEEAFAMSDRQILQIESTHTIAELEQLEKQHLIDFVGLVHSFNTAHYSKPVRDVMAYIRSHLSEKLSLQQLADMVFLHPSYLSTLFKRETGTTLSRYIMSQRIEEAKFFLRYTGNKTSDIANFYQFSSQSHFISWFARLTGTTPERYRKTTDSRTGI